MCNRRLHHHLLCELCISLARIFPSTSFGVFFLFEGALYKCRKVPLCSVSYIFFSSCLCFVLYGLIFHTENYLKFFIHFLWFLFIFKNCAIFLFKYLFI